jgi:hypothetical protein
LVINHIKRRYKIKKEKLKHYARRVWEIIDSFNSFNISFVPQEKNQKVDSLAVATSLFNTDDSQNQNTFHVKTIFRPSIPDNQEYWKVFENDEHIANFLVDQESTSSDISEKVKAIKRRFMIKILLFSQRIMLALNLSSQGMTKQRHGHSGGILH